MSKKSHYDPMNPADGDSLFGMARIGTIYNMPPDATKVRFLQSHDMFASAIVRRPFCIECWDLRRRGEGSELFNMAWRRSRVELPMEPGQGKVDMDQLRLLFEDARRRGRTSGAFLKFAETMFDSFGAIYNTARSMQNSVDLMRMVDKLRDAEGSTVTWMNDNPDFNGLPDAAVEVSGDWTNYEPRRFEGRNVLMAVHNAWSALLAAKAAEKEAAP